MLQAIIGVSALGYAAGNDLGKNGKKSTTAKVVKTVARAAAPVPSMAAEQIAKHPKETKKVAQYAVKLIKKSPIIHARMVAPVQTAVAEQIVKHPKETQKAVKFVANIVEKFAPLGFTYAKINLPMLNFLT